jgi:hypothetical protein
MSDDLTLIIMAGGGGETPAEQAVAGACRAAARDAIERAGGAGVADRIIVATDQAAWANTLSDLPVTIDLDTSGTLFHFGRRLAGVIERHDVRRAFYLGGGSAPLMDGATWRAIADSIRHDDGVIVTNNIFSSDWAAFAPAEAAVKCADQLRSDNSLGWVLSRTCGLTAREWPRSAATQFDLDTPTDLLIAGLHRPFESIGPHLSAHIASLGWDDSHVRAARQALLTPAKQVIIAGRVPQSTLALLESRTLCWLRVFSEERGMRASGRLAGGLVRSLLADYLALVGLEHFFAEMGELADAMFLDSRVIMAARKWPLPADRFNSDLRHPDDITDPFLRDFTAAALAAPIPVVLGGHSLVSGGLLALIAD